ncbi:NAD synthetase [Neptunomonas phycophila]|uniref:NAD synthetase n=1 Tax=Neptunomonas phycophila TaxID=1572645 RepID=UPI0015BB0AD5|nr:NAD synthetase [Neptunomonas phycophila]QLE99188.1 NAD synthetase [Neptunomonas phycophila]
MDLNTLLGRQTFGQQYLQSRLEISLDKQRLFSAIDADPALSGAGVVYVDSRLNVITLREFEPVCRIKPIKVVIRKPLQALSDQQFIATSKDPRESKMVMEAISTGLACAGMAFSIIAIFTSAAAIPVTGGTSSAMTYVAYTAALATGAQCINGAARVTMEAVAPSRLDALDSEEWYSTVMIALDVISLAGVAVSGYQMIKYVKVLNSEGQSVRTVLQGLNRTERKRLTEEIIRQNRPGVSNKMRKMLQAQGVYPIRYAADRLQRTTVSQIYDSFAALLAFTGSAGSGVVRQLSINVYEEF